MPRSLAVSYSTLSRWACVSSRDSICVPRGHDDGLYSHRSFFVIHPHDTIPTGTRPIPSFTIKVCWDARGIFKLLFTVVIDRCFHPRTFSCTLVITCGSNERIWHRSISLTEYYGSERKFKTLWITIFCYLSCALNLRFFK